MFILGYIHTYIYIYKRGIAIFICTLQIVTRAGNEDMDVFTGWETWNKALIFICYLVYSFGFIRAQSMQKNNNFYTEALPNYFIFITEYFFNTIILNHSLIICAATNFLFCYEHIEILFFSSKLTSDVWYILRFKLKRYLSW